MAAPYSFIIKGTELVDIINLVPFFYVKLAHNKTDVRKTRHPRSYFKELGKSWIYYKFPNQRSVVLDDESLDAYLEAHKRLGLEAGYLSKIVEEKKLERDFIISKYDDLLYVLRTQKTCKPLYEIIIRELAALILHPVARNVFYSISIGESVEKVAGRHRITYEKTLQIYNSILKGLKLKKDILATYRKRAINARFLSLADNNKNINIEQEEWILQLPVCKVADTRLANVLYNQDVRTVKDLLEIVSGRGWKSLLRIEGVGKISYYHLLSKLQMIGVVDESLDRILAGHSVGRFEKR